MRFSLYVLVLQLAGAIMCFQVASFARKDIRLNLKSYQISQSKELMIGERHIFDGSTCNGDNVSPQISWTRVASARSYAVTMFDPDANTGSGWWHWIVYDIPSSAKMLDEGWGKQGVEFLTFGVGKHATNDFGFYGYSGPCPPIGDGMHRYVFTVYALNVDYLPVHSGSTSASIRMAIMNHKIAESYIVGYYER